MAWIERADPTLCGRSLVGSESLTVRRPLGRKKKNRRKLRRSASVPHRQPASLGFCSRAGASSRHRSSSPRFAGHGTTLLSGDGILAEGAVLPLGELPLLLIKARQDVALEIAEEASVALVRTIFDASLLQHLDVRRVSLRVLVLSHGGQRLILQNQLRASERRLRLGVLLDGAIPISHDCDEQIQQNDSRDEEKERQEDERQLWTRCLRAQLRSA
eukprot:scaffold889_cov268-Pinguiococcus_pyrenoidosus.AAC.17